MLPRPRFSGGEGRGEGDPCLHLVRIATSTISSLPARRVALTLPSCPLCGGEGVALRWRKAILITSWFALGHHVNDRRSGNSTPPQPDPPPLACAPGPVL